LLDTRDTYRPINYPKALEYWKKQQQMQWLPDEVDFNEDRKDWDSKLSEGERTLLSKLFRFFTQGDILVQDAYLDKYIPVIGKQPEVKMMMTAFANMETVHIVAYAKLLDTVGMADAEFEAFKQHKQMMAKVDYLMQFDPNKFQGLEKHCDILDESVDAYNIKRELAKTLAVYSAFMEGLQLFSSFAVLMNFTRFNKMKGMGKIIEWSVRDELLHCEGMTWLFRTFIKENPDIWTDEFKKEIYEACRTMIRLEDNFIDLMFKEVDVEGLTPEELKRYIRFIADRRLADLGLKANYHVKDNPLPWMDWMLADSHTNFFESRVTEYSKLDDVEYF
jgi:ribonucleoside-diphosphate reductase beta chain